VSDPTIEHRFSLAASTYNEVAEVQVQVAQTLSAMLPPPAGIVRMLEVGCGTGLLTQHLIDRYPDAEIHALDISSAMIGQAKQQVSRHVQSWICADYTSFDTELKYDLICSSSTLHWLTPLEETLSRIRSQLSPHGHFYAALMLHDTFKELHDLRNQLFPHKPVEQRLPTAEEVTRVLPPNYALDLETISSPITAPRSFFTALHKLGVTGGSVSRAQLTPSELKQLMANFNAQSATWQIGYVRPI
jgi:malonyl-CoA O-methyltransferase